MDVIIRRSSNSQWPLEATYGNKVLSFSGSLLAGRVKSEQLSETLKKSSQAIFTVIGAIGIGALLIAGLMYGAGLDIRFVKGLFLAIFWISIIGDMYLLALRHESKRVQLSVAEVNLAPDSPNSNFDLYEMFTQEAQGAWNSAVSLADASGNVPANAMLATLLKAESVRTAFFRLGVNPDDVVAAVTADTNNPSNIVSELPFAAFELAMQLRNNAIDPLMLTLSLIKHLPQQHSINQFFFERGINWEDLQAVAVWTFNVRLLIEEDVTFRRLARMKPSGGVNKGLTSVPTKYLDQFSSDLTNDAKFHQLPMAMGREADVDALCEIFSDKLVNVLIKGAEGTGRTTVIQMLAHRMVEENVPLPLQDKRLVKLELSAILGGQLPAEQVLTNALAEASLSGNIILVLEDIDMLARATGSQGLSLLDQMMNILQKGGLSVIATTTPERYLTDLHKQSNLDSIFTTHELTELSEESILAACCIRASLLESQHGVIFLFSTIKEAFNLSNRYMKDAAQPQKTIGLLAEAAAKHKGEQKVVTPEDIQKVVGEKTHVPEETITQSEGDKLLNLEDELGKYVIGQQEAVVAVAESLRRARSGLASENRPLASFLFVGPTGVGKTELARTLTKIYFGDEKYLLRLDMSEYQGESGIEKLLGNVDNANTAFVTHLQNYPFCLFLLDEFEKASPAVINLFLQILEDGRITTAAGQTLDATQTIIIATSNAGTKEVQAGLREGQTLEQIRSMLVNQILTQHYPPELLNRFDGVILFSPLSTDNVEQIVKLNLDSLSKTLLEKGFVVTFGQALVSKVAVEAYDPMLGARPIRRYIQDHVESVIAKLILSKSIQRGAKMNLDLVGDEIVAQPIQ